MSKDRPESEEEFTMLSFAQAAECLIASGHVRSMTPEGLRKLARTDPEWPITPEEYGRVAGARLLPYERVVKYFETRSKRKGRGPAQPRADGDK